MSTSLWCIHIDNYILSKESIVYTSFTLESNKLESEQKTYFVYTQIGANIYDVKRVYIFMISFLVIVNYVIDREIRIYC